MTSNNATAPDRTPITFRSMVTAGWCVASVSWARCVAGSTGGPGRGGRALSYRWRRRLDEFQSLGWSGLGARRGHARYLRRMALCTLGVHVLEPAHFACLSSPPGLPVLLGPRGPRAWSRLDNVLYTDLRRARQALGLRSVATDLATGHELPGSCLPGHDLLVRTVAYHPHAAANPARFLTVRVQGIPGQKTAPPPRRAELQALRAAGVLGVLDATRLFPVLPAADAPAEDVPPRWRIEVRQLLIVAHDDAERVMANPALVPPRPQDPRRLRIELHLDRVERPTRRQFATAVARLLAYPPYLLVGDPVPALAALDACGDRRLVATGGIFYGAG